MNINSISFGRGIKMQGPKRVAEQIQSAVNKKQYSKNGKALKEFATQIFYDANTPGGNVEVFSLSSNQHYLFSGEEAKKARQLIENTRYNCEKIKNDAKRAAKTKEQEFKYGKIATEQVNKHIQCRNEKLEELTEDGINSPRVSFMVVEPYREYLEGDVMKQEGAINYCSLSEQVTNDSTFIFKA